MINSNYSLNDILNLDDKYKRVRYSKKVESSRLKRITDYFKSTRQLDIRDYELYHANLIGKKIDNLKKLATELKKPEGKSVADEFFINLKEILHVNAKIKFYGWSKSLHDNKNYQDFEKNLKDLQDFAKQQVKEWIEKDSLPTSQVEKRKIQRWIEADELQLLFSGYSNEIVYKAEEIPLGAVLLSNPVAGKVADKMQGYKVRIARRIQSFKAIWCQLFTGLPVTHAMASLGNGQFIHVDDGKDIEYAHSNNQAKFCSGRPILEDHSIEARKKGGKKGSKYMFGYEIVEPNKEAIAKQNNIHLDSVNDRLNRWKDNMLRARKKGPVSKINNIIATIFNPYRPPNYSIETVFDPTHSYSCSGLISSAMAAEGIDVNPKKKVNKVTPSDFISSPIFDLVYSNNRKLFTSVRGL